MSDIGNIDFLHFTVGNHQLMCVLDLCWCVMCNAEFRDDIIQWSCHLSVFTRQKWRAICYDASPCDMFRLDMATHSILLFPHEDEN